jgi:DNA-binding NtrC family response regulator
MSRIETLLSVEFNALSSLAPVVDKFQPLILVVADGQELLQDLGTVCEFLDLAVQRVAGDDDLSTILQARRPMAVVAELNGADQDGCYVLMTVASHDRDLPVLMVANDDPALLGAVDAIEELWGLTAVDKATVHPKLGSLVDFVFRAGHRGGVTQFMPI